MIHTASQAAAVTENAVARYLLVRRRVAGNTKDQ